VAAAVVVVLVAVAVHKMSASGMKYMNIFRFVMFKVHLVLA